MQNTNICLDIKILVSDKRGKGISFSTSRVGEIGGIGEPVGIVDVEITKNDDFRAWIL